MTVPSSSPPRRFQFERDTFAFRHELVWNYKFDPVTGAMTTHKADPPPTYYHRCFVIVRAARLFFDHARFAPEQPAVDAETYRALVRQVMARSPRRACPEAGRIVIPGYDSLRAFSREHEPLLKAECGAPWESYFLRSHWRMIFPVSGRFERQMAEKLKRAIVRRGVSLAHLFRFPQLTINHGILLYRFGDSEERTEFDAYDPNLPEHPVTLVYEKKRRVFTFAPNLYWGGGILSVMEIYCEFPY
jgi:hypothetical protein